MRHANLLMLGATAIAILALFWVYTGHRISRHYFAIWEKYDWMKYVHPKRLDVIEFWGVILGPFNYFPMYYLTQALIEQDATSINRRG